MSVRTGARGYPQRAAQLLGSTVDCRLRPAVEDLNDVNLRCDSLNGRLSQVPPAPIVRMFQVDEAALFLDGGNGLFRRQSLGNDILKEQPDELALGG